MKPISIPLERQKQQKKVVRLLPWSLLAPSGTCYAPGSLLSRNLQQREGEESGFSVNHDPFFSPGAFRKWLNIPQGKPGCLKKKKREKQRCVWGESYKWVCRVSYSLSLGSSNDTAAEDRAEGKAALPAWETERFPNEQTCTAGLLRGCGWGGREVSAGENKASCYLSQPEESWEHFKTKQAAMSQLLLLRVSW